jgi:Type II CAAX prenyl endopeptidase Rce1-like
MNALLLQWLTFADVTLLPAFVLLFIWRLQFHQRWTWTIILIWVAASFLLHRDTPKTLGWRSDNLWPATRQTLILMGGMALGLILLGLALRAPRQLPPHLVHWSRFEGYLAFCVMQQVALNSLFQNRMLSIFEPTGAGAFAQSATSSQSLWRPSILTGILFAICHWPNPVLVPLTFIGGTAMAWLFARHRNIIPLAIGQAVLGSLIFWAFPIAWHHHLRVGPGYFM